MVQHRDHPPRWSATGAQLEPDRPLEFRRRCPTILHRGSAAGSAVRDHRQLGGFQHRIRLARIQGIGGQRATGEFLRRQPAPRRRIPVCSAHCRPASSQGRYPARGLFFRRTAAPMHLISIRRGISRVSPPSRRSTFCGGAMSAASGNDSAPAAEPTGSAAIPPACWRLPPTSRLSGSARLRNCAMAQLSPAACTMASRSSL